MAGRGRIKRVAIIGAGNVATHLAGSLSPYYHIIQIYSRNKVNAEALAAAVGCQYAIDNLTYLVNDADLYLISVTDDAIPGIVEATTHINTGIWVHTSGSTPMSIFSGKKERYGVFYPLQTFSKEKDLDISDVSLLIEGNSAEVTEELIAVADSISKNVSEVNSEGRAKLHIAAVFSCNFVNYMWSIADDLLKDSGLSINSMLPLLKETLQKLNYMSPMEAQTGPARRGDIAIIDRHLSHLSGSNREIYQLLSESILQKYNPDKR